MTNRIKASTLNTGKLEGLVHKKAQLAEHTISYEILEGSPKPERTIILHHGAFSTRNTMKILAKEIADLRSSDRIILVDGAWHGDSTSEKSIEGATVNTYADVMAEFVDTLKEDGTIQGKLTWVGWSMGGSIGMLLDLKGTVIDELVLVNSSPVWIALEEVVKMVPPLADPNTARAVFKGVMAEEFKEGVTEEERSAIRDNYDSLIDSGDIMVNDLKALAVSDYDIRERLGEIKAKTMIYSAADDGLATVDMQDVLEQGIKGSVKHVNIAGGHSGLMKPNDAETIASSFVEVFTV